MFQGVSPVLLYLLMAFGAVCAFAGLALMFRPPKVEGETRLELLGMKFNASSGSVIVFLIGALFLSAPIFVPERRSAAIGAAVAANADRRAPVVAVEPGDLPMRKRAEGRELEPNDSFDTANRLDVGGSVLGKVDDAGGDWFILAVEPNKPSLLIHLRNNMGICILNVFSSEEKKIGNISNYNENTSEKAEISLSGFPALILQVMPYKCSYEFFTDYR